jgi:hypothetical protein
MLLLAEPRIDSIVRHRRVLVLGGLVLVGQVFVLPRGWGCGVLSGFMLFSLGIYGTAFQKWRTDPGLWMLAVLLTVTLGPCWAYFEYLHWHSVFTPPLANQVERVAVWEKIRMSVDAVIGLLLMERAVRLAVSVATENWRRTRANRQKPDMTSPWRA